MPRKKNVDFETEFTQEAPQSKVTINTKSEELIKSNEYVKALADSALTEAQRIEAALSKDHVETDKITVSVIAAKAKGNDGKWDDMKRNDGSKVYSVQVNISLPNKQNNEWVTVKLKETTTEVAFNKGESNKPAVTINNLVATQHTENKETFQKKDYHSRAIDISTNEHLSPATKAIAASVLKNFSAEMDSKLNDPLIKVANILNNLDPDMNARYREAAEYTDRRTNVTKTSKSQIDIIGSKNPDVNYAVSLSYYEKDGKSNPSVKVSYLGRKLADSERKKDAEGKPVGSAYEKYYNNSKLIVSEQDFIDCRDALPLKLQAAIVTHKGDNWACKDEVLKAHKEEVKERASAAKEAKETEAEVEIDR